MKNAKKLVKAIAIILCVLLFVSGCQSRQETVRNEGKEIFQSIYLPSDAVILNQYEQDSIVAQVVGCTGIEILVAYGINRPADEVLNEYIEDLSAAGWNLPYWNDDPKEIPSFYKGDAYVHLSFSTPPDMIAGLMPGGTLKSMDYTTIYLVNFSYAVPTKANADPDCDF